MDRELNSVELPSGLKAKIVTYFTHGEEGIINNAKWSGAVVKNQDDNIVIENVPVNQNDLTQNAIVVQGTKEIDGKSVDEKVINDLREDDFKFLLGKLLKAREPKKKGK